MTLVKWWLELLLRSSIIFSEINYKKFDILLVYIVLFIKISLNLIYSLLLRGCSHMTILGGGGGVIWVAHNKRIRFSRLQDLFFF